MNCKFILLLSLILGASCNLKQEKYKSAIIYYNDERFVIEKKEELSIIDNYISGKRILGDKVMIVYYLDIIHNDGFVEKYYGNGVVLKDSVSYINENVELQNQFLNLINSKISKNNKAY